MSSQKSTFLFKKFSQADFQNYKSWFENSSLQTALGNIDEEWLNHVLQEEEGIEYAVFQQQELVAVVGIVYPTGNNPSFVITNIAVHPDLINNGLGSKVLKQLIRQTAIKTNENWICYVDRKNYAAQRFFEKNDWLRIEDANEEMLLFEYRNLKRILETNK